MGWIAGIGSFFGVATIIISVILTVVSTSKITRFERYVSTDYKKVKTKFINFSIIVVLSSFTTVGVVVSFFPDLTLSDVVIIFISMLILASSILFLIYQIVCVVRKQQDIYFIEGESAGDKLYIHKAISVQEFILSNDVTFNNESSDFQIVKREYLYGKNIKKERINK